MRQHDPDMHTRLCEEIYRLGASNKEAARKLDCPPDLVGIWLRDGYIPSAYYLKNFCNAGADVIYILTGRRSM